MEFRTVGLDNLVDILKLKVQEHQEHFVASNQESILDAFATRESGFNALPFGIYEGERPVGFVMFGYGKLADSDEPRIAEGNYCIWRFMIDHEFQGKGLGKKAFQLALDYVRSSPCGPADYCWLAFEPNNTVARKLYESFGFAENGEYCGSEIVEILKL